MNHSILYVSAARLYPYLTTWVLLSVIWIWVSASAKSVGRPCNLNRNQSDISRCAHDHDATDKPYSRFSLPSTNDDDEPIGNGGNSSEQLSLVDSLIFNVLPALIRDNSNAESSSSSQQRLPSTQSPSPSVLFLMWSELLRLDLSLPFETDDGELRNKASVHIDASFLYDYDASATDSSYAGAAIKMQNGFLLYEPCNQCNHTHWRQQQYHHHHVQQWLLQLLVNEHNRIAGILRQKYPVWDAQALFENARKVLIAEIQRITYVEYLPTLLGRALAQNINTTYDQTAEDGIDLSVNDIFFKAIEYSASNQNSIVPDENSKLTINNFARRLTRETNNGYLFNLNREQIADILKSSRRHRIPSYGKWREFCARTLRQSHLNISSHLDDDRNAAIESIYGRTSEADLLIAELAEERVPEGQLGVTLACIVYTQFHNTIRGDKYWYSRRDTRNPFSPDQLNEIEKTTLNGLICSNAIDHDSVSKNAFIAYNSETNPLIDCASQTPFQLTAWKENDHRRKNISTNKIKERLLKKAIRKAEDDLNRRKQTEFLLWSNRGGVDPKSPIGIAAAFSKPNRHALLLANNSILLEYASNELLNLLQKNGSARRRKRQLFDGDDSILSISDDFNGDFLQDLDISGLVPPDAAIKNLENGCPAEVGPCDPNYPYRSYTGYCNNLRKPNYGKSLTTFTRLLPPAYENGISKPRQRSVMGIALPSARLVSSLMHLDISHLHNKYTLMLMQFAQFVDHDITFTPVHRGFFASIPDCRPCDSPLTVHPECMPIEVPAGDPYYPQINFTSGQRFCLPFMRSLPGQQRLGSREQINQNSAFLDASQVYGEHACLARQLRSFQGRLNTTISLFGDKDLLPQSPLHPECKAPSGYCFIAGDGRASEQPGLTVIHTIFMREHNRLADSLRFLNPHWDDERLYQQARRISIAEYQHVVYNEFLPRLLGHNAMHLYGLSLEPHPQYFKGYSDECNPSALSEFVSAAFRIGHSLLRPHIPRMSSLYQPVEPSILLRDTFFNPDVIYQVNNLVK